MAHQSIELVFFSLTPRLYILRILAVSALFICTINVEWFVRLKPSPPPVNHAAWIALYAFITVHQVLSAFNSKVLYGALDFLLLVTEVIGAGKYAMSMKLHTWQPETLVFHVALAWIIVACLSMTVIYRIADALKSRGRSLITPVSLVAPNQTDAKSKGTQPVYLLFGRAIWRQNFVGENKIVRGIRGVFAIVVLGAVLFYALLSVIFEPVYEAALSPVKESRITGTTPMDLVIDTLLPAWNIIYPLATLSAINNDDSTLHTLISNQTFFSAVNVTAIWPNFNGQLPSPPCTQNTIPYGKYGNPIFIYRCPAINITDPNTGSFSTFLPDLQINIDFEPLVPMLFGVSQASFSRISLPLVIGLVDDMEENLLRNMPTVFIPGANMAASVVVDIRQVYSNGALASLGLFQVTKTFWMPRFISWFPEPFPSFKGTNLASLNIFWQSNFGELKVVQDYRDTSVISGFSAVGGLWSAFSGILAIFFGASMMQILYGSKPISIFGIAHQFQAEEMKRECLKRYPNITEENSVPEKRGLLALLKDHLIDLSFLEEKAKHVPPGLIRETDEERADGDQPVLRLERFTSEGSNKMGTSSQKMEEKVA